jgi:hypothetical protein
MKFIEITLTIFSGTNKILTEKVESLTGDNLFHPTNNGFDVGNHNRINIAV